MSEGDDSVRGAPRTVVQAYDLADPENAVSDLVDSGASVWFGNDYADIVVDAQRPVVTFEGVRNGSYSSRGVPLLADRHPPCFAVVRLRKI